MGGGSVGRGGQHSFGRTTRTRLTDLCEEVVDERLESKTLQDPNKEQKG